MAANLSQSDIKMLSNAWLCFDTVPKVDMQKLAEVCQYKNKGTAATIYSATKKRLLANPSKLSESDVKLLSRAWFCFEAPPKVNMQKLADVCGYKNKGTAATIFSAAKKRIFASAGVEGGAGTPKAVGKKRAAPAGGEDGGSEKKQKAKKCKAELGASDDEDSKTLAQDSPMQGLKTGFEDEDFDEDGLIKTGTMMSDMPEMKVKTEDDDGLEKLLSGAQEYANGGSIGGAEDSEDEV